MGFGEGADVTDGNGAGRIEPAAVAGEFPGHAQHARREIGQPFIA
jgi:hypothetical protein